ncbi:ABC transporter permease subunit [Nonomuraea phyllanthi]|uniref:ABC transporter permease subunit n=1 Tax=Nonomuraea phyllanthi TaxID=2219224 RepID=A0A5C4VD33_9ACTN|nr:ABC transporter permease [Nonomuraea phyllanthi]KAB8188391.1 ABC transporter permease subunit [Nonomuraea phyllanthi]
MFRDIRQRLLASAVTIVLASFVSFVVLRALPGDPARLIAGPLAGPETLAATRSSLGLDRPFFAQYGQFLWNFVRGDWGYSFSVGDEVREALTSRLTATLELALYAFVLAVVGALVCASVASFRPGFRRGLVRLFALVGLGSPPFWVGLVLIVVFSSYLGWWPGPSGRLSPQLYPPEPVTGFYTVDFALHGDLIGVSDSAAHLVLPVVSLALLPWAFLTRLLTANMADTAGQPYILVVRSKGVPAWRTHVRHVLANSLLPTVSSCGLILATLITGSVLVETVFNWPGVGAMLTEGISAQDFALVQSFILLSAILYVVGNLVGDAVNRMIDARLRTPGAAR